MTYAVQVFPIPTIAVAGSEEVFPVRRIYAVGRNYADHAAETGLGGGGGPVPGFSLKPADSVVAGGDLPYPPGTGHLDPEVELVVAIGRGGSDIARENAAEHIFGYAVGFDMIRRDIMQECIRNQHSWDMCKSFDGASPCSPIRRTSEIGHPRQGEISITVNGEIRQRGNIADLIWPAEEIVARLSALSRLEPGDIIFTGTPKGPRPVVRGDRLEGRVEGIGELSVTIV